MSDFHTIHAGGEERILACLPRTSAPGGIFPLLESAIAIIPRAKWEPCDYRHLVPEILDQDGQGACNAFASTLALRVCRIAAGLPDARLSPGNLYGRINGGRDQGSTLGDALQELQERGCCTMDTIGPLVWQKRKWPAGWEAEAAKYRLIEAYDCPTFDAIASAILSGFVVDYGILVGNAFSDVDSDGWVAEGRGGGGHALCGIGLASRQSRGKTEWGVVTANSWGEQWGNGGFGIVPESYFRNEVFTDGWAARVPSRVPDQYAEPTA